MSADLLAGVKVGDYVVLEQLSYSGRGWVRYDVRRVDRTTPRRVIVGGEIYHRGTGEHIPRGTLYHYRARPETAEERADREARAAATQTIADTLRLGRAPDLSHMSTARLVAIAAACKEPAD